MKLLRALWNLLLATMITAFYAAFFGSLWIFQASVGIGAGFFAFLGVVYLLLLPLLFFVPGCRGRRMRRFLFSSAALVLLGCTGFTLQRITGTTYDPTIQYCRDSRCGDAPPWYSRVIREEEVALSGMGLARMLGSLSESDFAETAPALQSILQFERQRLQGRAVLNPLLLSFNPGRVEYLYHRPPGVGPFPALVF